MAASAFSNQTRRILAWAVVALLATPLASRATNPNFRACFTSMGTPTIDGVVRTDPGWNTLAFGQGTWKYEMGNGTSVPNALVRVLRNAGNLFLGFEVNNDSTFDNDDVIVVTFDPGGGGNLRRLHIFPIFTGIGAGAGGNPREVSYWKGSAGAWGPATVNPPWLEAKVSSAAGGLSNTWAVEMRIPITASAADPNGINIPASGDFGLYFNILRVAGGAGTVTQLDWPPPAPDIGAPAVLNLETGTPNPTDWGNGTRGGVPCNGVSITGSDIATNNVPSSDINLNGPNIFTANPHNSSLDNAGSPVAAQQVRAQFRIRNYGLGEDWALVPTGNNPSPPADIPANGTVSLSTSAWNLTAAERALYAANRHQCIRVELSSSAGSNTTFVNDAAVRNMDFVGTASPFEGKATISSRGFEKAVDGSVPEFLLTEITYNTPREAVWLSEHKGIEPIGGIGDNKGSSGGGFFPRQYVVRVSPDQPREVLSRITPPAIRIPIEWVAVPAGTGGLTKVFRRPSGRKAIPIRVQPGSILTLLAEGTIQIGKERVGPLGIPRPAKPAGSAAPHLLLDSAGIGALVGSFDGFRTAFLIGDAISVRVPAKVQELLIAINDADGHYGTQVDGGFRVQVTQTPARPEPFYADLNQLRLPLGANLPTWMMCGELKTGKSLQINKTTYQVTRDAGCYGYIVRSIGGPVRNPPAGTVKPRSEAKPGKD